jgi:integrase
MIAAAEMVQIIELARTINEQQKMLATALAKLAKIEEVASPESLNLLETWDKYIDFKRPSVSPSYLAHQLQATRNHLEKLSSSPGMDAVAIRDWAMKHLTVDSAKRLVSQLSACYTWAKNNKLIEVNPFMGMTSEIKLPRSKRVNTGDREIEPFTATERDSIIVAFKSNQFCHPFTPKNYQHSNYATYVEFLFYTGCRPSEAIGLQWKNIDFDKRIVLFQEAVVQSPRGRIRKGGLKTQAFRKFKINDQLREILESAKPLSRSAGSLVFPAPEGGFIVQDNFRKRVWKKILQGLDLQYRVPYQTRHTFITLCLDKGIDAKDIAQWVGNSPEIIYKHYAGSRHSLQVPVI